MLQKIIDLFNHGIFGNLAAKEQNEALAVFYIVFPCALLLASGYLIGSLNPAIFFSKKLYGKDIRESGSGNAGMTNMLRTHGKKAGIITAVCDLGKAIASCLIGYIIFGYDGAALAGFATMLGHIAPVFYKFKGGKGVLVAAGTLLCLDPIVFVITLAIFAGVFFISKTVSIASIMSILVYPYIFLKIGGHYGVPGVCAILTMALVIFMHRKNIQRIFEGTEPKTTVGGKKKATTKEIEETHENTSEPSEESEPVRKSKPNPNTSKKKAKKRK